jgi:hypothetical protein
MIPTPIITYEIPRGSNVVSTSQRKKCRSAESPDARATDRDHLMARASGLTGGGGAGAVRVKVTRVLYWLAENS